MAHGAFNHLDHAWQTCHLSRKTKAQLLITCVAPVLLYGSEHWALTAARIQKLCNAWMCFVRKCLRLTSRQAWESHTSHSDMLRDLGVPSLLTLLQRRLGGWLGHIARMTPDRLPQATLVGVPADRVFVRFKGVLFVSRAKALLQHLPGIDDRVWATQARDRALCASSVRRLVVEPQNRRTAAAHRHHMQPVRTRRASAVAVDPLQCPSCPYRARNIQGLQRHISQKHPTGDSQWVCEHCQQVFGRKGALALHLPQCIAAHVPGAPPAPAPGRAAARSAAARPHVCPDRHCGLTLFTTLSALNRRTREQCLGRQGSGATLQADGRYALRCSHPHCAASAQLFYSTRALGIHRKKNTASPALLFNFV